MKLVQILFLSLQWLQANGEPLLFQGISVKRSFDISLKPLPIKPLSFIKEKWSPFGVFRKKHTIQRRGVDSAELAPVPVEIVIEKQSSLVIPQNEGSLVYPASTDGPIVTVPSAPVSEEPEPVTVAPLYVQSGSQPAVPQSIPPQDAVPVLVPVVEPVVPIVSADPVEATPELAPEQVVTPQQVVIPPASPTLPIDTPVVTPVVASPLPSVPLIVPPGAAPASPPQIVPLVVNQPSIPGSVMIPSGSLVPAPVLGTGTIEDLAPTSILPPINTVPFVNRAPNFVTNIFRIAPGLINTPFGKRMSPIESNSIDGSTNLNESSFIRGSKMALHLGNMVFKAVSQLFGNARVTLDRLTSPPPIYLN